ncbi:MAG: hypothetical protein CMJ83_17520 [Planctomycetes bacterium]|nr:hypothetical protein [Planctomycetota bacterium]
MSDTPHQNPSSPAEFDEDLVILRGVMALVICCGQAAFLAVLGIVGWLTGWPWWMKMAFGVQAGGVIFLCAAYRLARRALNERPQAG